MRQMSRVYQVEWRLKLFAAAFVVFSLDKWTRTCRTEAADEGDKNSLKW